ncbi:uncharacterized protein LOC117162972 isoform X3 [Bombus vancouverensis nearcticus]|uniref:uncharacterized protein LOC117161838 isoform X3 n=2 Tax=Bombus vancouverensis nearcticus TaxID=2705178 RepID=UPI00143C9885|nr:uncharacterized protein LOC117161838 isoform X3 [Bombus vancouverensis nearcticus]
MKKTVVLPSAIFVHYQNAVFAGVDLTCYFSFHHRFSKLPTSLVLESPCPDTSGYCWSLLNFFSDPHLIASDLITTKKMYCWRFFLKVIIIAVSVPPVPLYAFSLKNDATNSSCVDFHGETIRHALTLEDGLSVCSYCICYNSRPAWCTSIVCHPPEVNYLRLELKERERWRRSCL